MANANTSYPQGGDPFFWLPNDSDWNACIGVQGDEENYVDGYIEAAVELANAVIEKRMYGKRDTLVMPILYNARHALELLLKFTINKLNKMEIVKHAHAKNHDIKSHWELLQSSQLGDQALQQCVAALEPYVTSLSQIDDDGQELRYSENREGQTSLAERSLANIEVIRTSLNGVGELSKSLKFRILDLGYERSTGSYTAECSRLDLLEIARMLPDRSQWCEPVFVEAKASVMMQFNLSGGKFSKAVKTIEGSREMRCLIGLETGLVYLRDENALLSVEQWAKRHPVRPIDDDFGIINFGKLSKDAMLEDQKVAHATIKKIIESLTPEEIADLETIFRIGREGIFCEHYESILESTLKTHRAQGDLTARVLHLIDKVNFQKEVVCGVSKLGRPGLANKLLDVQRDVPPA